MWPLRAPAAAAAAASCTRLTPRCSGGDLRCGCQVPNTLQSLGGGLVEAAAEANDLLTGDGGRGGSDVVDDGGERAVGSRAIFALVGRETCQNVTKFVVVSKTCPPSDVTSSSIS